MPYRCDQWGCVMNNAITLNPQEIISVNNNELKTTSVFVADAFKKRHDNIIRKIDEVLTQVPDNFGKLNFEETEYEQKNNLGKIVKHRSFNITKDGFMLLVMGFTGKLAMQIKIAYIEAFNFMAEKLAKPQQLRLEDLSTVQSREPLKNAVNMMVSRCHLNYSDCYKMIHQQFGVSSVEELTDKQVKEAVKYVHGHIVDITPPDNSQMFYGLRDGRYVVVVCNGQTTIRNINGCSIVDRSFTDAIRKNFGILSKQMRLLSGEESPTVLDMQMEMLPNVN